MSSPARLLCYLLLGWLGSTIASTSEWPCSIMQGSKTSRRPPVLMRLPKWNAFVSELQAAGPNNKRFETVNFLKILDAELEAIGAPTNVIMIGACDGTHDEVIEHSLKRKTTSMLMVEPVGYNADDVDKLIAGVEHQRMQLFRGAVDSGCDEEGSTRTFTQISKAYESGPSKHADQRHFARRQLGSLHPSVGNFLKARYPAYAEQVTVDCLSPRRLLQRFASLQTRLTASIARKGECTNGKGWPLVSANVRSHLPDLHMLKIDTEGADYMIMKAFMTEVWCKECVPIKDSENRFHLRRSHTLPLIIEYEYKVFESRLDGKNGTEKVNELEEWLRSNGYAIFRSAADDAVALRQFSG
mmetsp:Transcript_9768/g.20314  ORF Transcript_9768/g.20314 Transcript_9768/m.20314 type:complete len:356 (-) Transcript_9768:82-1149(-)